MNQAVQTIALLNRLLAIEYRSLAVYVMDASPWVARGEEQAATTVRNISLDQQAMAERIAEEILERGGRADSGDYPMEFTDLHDLALDYLIAQIVEAQRQDIATIERIVAALAHDPAAQDLAYEVLGSERAHLESLEALATLPSAAITSADGTPLENRPGATADV